MFNFTNCYVIPYFNKDGEREAFEKGRCVLTNVDYIGRGGVPVSSILTTDRGDLMIIDNEFDSEQLKYIPLVSYGKLFNGGIESYVEAYPGKREVIIKILYKHKTQETYYVEFSENIGCDDIDKVFRFINDNVVPRFRNNDTSGFDVEKYAKQDIPNIKSIHRYREGERKMVENNFGFKLVETAKVEQYEKIDEEDRVRIIIC